MRMRPHIRAFAGSERNRSEMIEKDERADHLGRECRQQSLHGEATQVARVGIEYKHDEILFARSVALPLPRRKRVWRPVKPR